jgi:hypothetical protein
MNQKMATKSERVIFEKTINNDRNDRKVQDYPRKQPEIKKDLRINKPDNITKRDIVWEERRQKRLRGQVDKLIINHSITKDTSYNLIDNEKNRKIYNFDGFNENSQYFQQKDNKLQNNKLDDMYYNDNNSEQSIPYKNQPHQNIEHNGYAPVDDYQKNQLYDRKYSQNKKTCTPNSNISNQDYTNLPNHQSLNKRTPNKNSNVNFEKSNNNYQKSYTYNENTIKKNKSPNMDYVQPPTPNCEPSNNIQNVNTYNQYTNKHNIQTPYNQQINQNFQNQYNQQSNINYNQQRYTPNSQYDQNLYEQNKTNVPKYNDPNFRNTPGYNQQNYDKSARQTPNQGYYNQYQQQNKDIYSGQSNQQKMYVNQTQTPNNIYYSQRQTPIQQYRSNNQNIDPYNNYQHNQIVTSPEMINQNYINTNNLYSQRNPINQNSNIRDISTPNQKPFSNVSFRNADTNRNNGAYIGRENNKFNYKI